MKDNDKIEYFKTSENSIFGKFQYRKNQDDAYKNAIRQGMRNPENWIYMYSKYNRDYFRNMCSKKFISFAQFDLIGTNKIKNKNKDKEILK